MRRNCYLGDSAIQESSVRTIGCSDAAVACRKYIPHIRHSNDRVGRQRHAARTGLHDAMVCLYAISRLHLQWSDLPRSTVIGLKKTFHTRLLCSSYFAPLSVAARRTHTTLHGPLRSENCTAAPESAKMTEDLACSNDITVHTCVSTFITHI
eukprot:6175534-Pleurochrysis_carterae.AAC.2